MKKLFTEIAISALIFTFGLFFVLWFTNISGNGAGENATLLVSILYAILYLASIIWLSAYRIIATVRNEVKSRKDNSGKD